MKERENADLQLRRAGMGLPKQKAVRKEHVETAKSSVL